MRPRLEEDYLVQLGVELAVHPLNLPLIHLPDPLPGMGASHYAFTMINSTMLDMVLPRCVLVKHVKYLHTFLHTCNCLKGIIENIFH